MTENLLERLLEPYRAAQKEVDKTTSSEVASHLGSIGMGGVVNSLDGPVNFIQYKDGSNIPTALSAEDSVARSIKAELVEARDAILAMPSVEDGINMTRVDAFRQRIGVPKKHLKVLSPDNFNAARNQFRVESPTNDHNEGAYQQHFDISIIRRDEKVMEKFGPEVLESLIVHEEAHASNTHSIMEVKTERKKKLFRKDVLKVDIDAARIGFVVSHLHSGSEGSFLEESYAEFERGRYVEEELHKPNGFRDPAEMDENSRFAAKYYVPYIDEAGNTQFGLPSGSMGAVTLELIASHDPQLPQIMRDSRHSAEGLREFAKHLNAVSSGLYQEMRKIDLGADDYLTEWAKLHVKVESIFEQQANQPAAT
ncbi:MAG TPA: hypothetical protein VLF39_03710 [Candidatus Saccharimonadales bacterium]|nr:hypothetical protein [Candidatus Saccharimonadales bacterium]